MMMLDLKGHEPNGDGEAVSRLGLIAATTDFGRLIELRLNVVSTVRAFKAR